MKSNRRHSLSAQILFVLSLLALCLGDDKFLLYTIKKSTFNALDFRRTDVEYKVPLPADLTGVVASAIRIRNRTFRLKGANLTSVYFPPGILSNPFTRRLLLVSYNLGRNLPTSLSVRSVAAGYSLVSPIVGLLAYDAWDVTSSNNSELGGSCPGVSGGGYKEEKVDYVDGGSGRGGEHGFGICGGDLGEKFGEAEEA